jgi:hypothetical protein
MVLHARYRWILTPKISENRRNEDFKDPMGERQITVDKKNREELRY